MGRTRTTNTRTRHLKAATNPQATSSAATPPSVPDLLAKAQSLVEQCNYQLAAQFLQRILETDATHVEARELLGVVQLELGDLDAARLTFQTLVQPSAYAYAPGHGGLPSAHLHLAQICEDDPRLSLKHYQAAVDILSSQLKGKQLPTPQTNGADSDSENNEREHRQTIAKALVGMTEIWLTDLCMEPEAEQNCNQLLTLALQVDPTNAEVLQCLASVRMSQQREAEASDLVLQAWSLWKDLPPDDAQVPTVPTRLSLTRLFLELSMYKEALNVLTGIIMADDQEVEAWYLEGWCFMLMGEDAKEKGIKVEDLSWDELARDARDCLETCRHLHESQHHADAALLQHVQELISQLAVLGIEPRNDQDQGGEWEDVSDSEDGDVEMES